MKDNIDSSSVLNRKIVIEIRYEPNLLFLDKKGSLLSEILKLKLFKAEHLGLNDTAITIADFNDNTKSRKHIHIGLNRFGFISSQVDTIDSFYNSFLKTYDIIQEIIDISNISRIGCRILGTYKVKSGGYDLILENFKKSFSNNFFMNDFPVKDCNIRINYQNGNYQVGPVSKDDEFLLTQFPYENKNNNPGVCIDTDNFLLKTDKTLDKMMIKDVYIASLSVEKALYEIMKDF